jgi:hypothetical protein
MRTLPASQYVRDMDVLVMKMKWGHICIPYKSTDEYLFNYFLELYWMVNAHFFFCRYVQGACIPDGDVGRESYTFDVPKSAVVLRGRLAAGRPNISAATSRLALSTRSRKVTAVSL